MEAATHRQPRKFPIYTHAPHRAYYVAALEVFGLLFTFGSFCIRIREQDGKLWLAMFHWKFWAWLAIWPGGIFRYPKRADIKGQFRRMRQMLVTVLSSIFALAFAGCAGKRIKTEPDGKRAAPSAWVMKASASTTTWPSYLGADAAVFYDGPVQQTNLTVNLPRGFYLGLWDSLPLSTRDVVPNYGYEIDVSGGWNGQLKGFNVNLDGTHIGVTPLLKYRGDVIQLSTMISRDIKLKGKAFTPYFWVRSANPTIGNSPGRGIFYHEGLRTGWQHSRWAGGVSIEVMHDSGAFGFNPGYFLKGGGSIGTNVGNHWRVEVPLRWSAPITKTNDGRGRELQAGLTFSVH